MKLLLNPLNFDEIITRSGKKLQINLKLRIVEKLHVENAGWNAAICTFVLPLTYNIPTDLVLLT